MVMADAAAEAMAAGSTKAGSIDWSPLVLSLMAGLSTCIGASVVFLARWRQRSVATTTTTTTRTAGPSLVTTSDGSTSTVITATSLKGKDLAAPLISHGHLCFSIAFAGSVMVTVSLFSLLPESFSSDEASSSSSSSSSSSFLLSPYTRDFWYRVASFLAGGGLCLLLSKAAFPEPEDVLDWNNTNDADVEMQPLVQERQIPTGQPPRQLSVVKRQSSTLTGTEKGLRPAPASLLVASSTLADVKSNPTDAVGAAPSERPRGTTSSNSGGGSWWSRFASGSDLATTEARRSWRVALLLFASLLAHNFPEGFAVAASSIHSPKLGVTTALAIAFHNIVRQHPTALPRSVSFVY
jgi:zinc transporter ZupT